MTTDKKKLRELAGAATKGEWKHRSSPFEVYNVDHGRLETDIVSDHNLICAMYDDGDNASFIAAANPETVKGLLDEIERLRGALKFYAEEKNYERIPAAWQGLEVIGTCIPILEKGRRARDALASNPDDAEVCPHIWEHLHGTDKNNEYRCQKCGSRKP